MRSRQEVNRDRYHRVERHSTSTGITNGAICTLACESPVTCLLMNRNWSPVPLTPVPPAVTMRFPPEDCSPPAGGLLMSWQVNPDGQFGSAGGVAGALPWPKAYR